ncbi:unnamed protein product [Allacma fusca]|uniref:Uncharacterized protein n=1 Tax=Allacma fusca TaxID=39272 RepID=A0A8J2NTT4_9HEXA|nr:unnamed protein product [Allacma fusca]
MLSYIFPAWLSPATILAAYINSFSFKPHLRIQMQSAREQEDQEKFRHGAFYVASYAYKRLVLHLPSHTDENLTYAEEMRLLSEEKTCSGSDLRPSFGPSQVVFYNIGVSGRSSWVQCQV